MSDLALSPEDMRSLQRHSSSHRKEVEESALCGCFYCETVFKPSEIKEWIDNDQTALCPNCTIDSVLGNKKVALATDANALRQMHQFWFEK